MAAPRASATLLSLLVLSGLLRASAVRAQEEETPGEEEAAAAAVASVAFPDQRFGPRYVIDEVLGLCCLRVPTWCPFRLQFYGNGHSWLLRKLAGAGIEFTAADNAVVRIADIQRAQALADSLKPDELHRRLDRYAQRLFPVGEVLGQATTGA